MFRAALVGQQIADIYVDTELTYIMLANGTQITIRGVVIVDVSQVTTKKD